MEIPELISRIIEVCLLDEPGSLMKRVKRALGADRANPFAVEKSGPPLEIRTRKEFDRYREKLLATGDLTAFAQRNKDMDSMKIYLKLINSLADDVEKKCILEYRADGDNSQMIAETVQSVILVKIKKIITSIYHQMEYKSGKERDALLEMIWVLNGYLSGLGIYTLIPEKGDEYIDEIMDRYEIILNNGVRIHKIPRVIAVEYPAYAIDYVDEENVRQTSWSNGKCIGE